MRGADDERAPALLSIFKQLLQAERLMKEYLLLLENVQSGLSLLIPHSMSDDWLRPNVSECMRKSVEMKEEMKKPTAQTIDLVSMSIFHLQSGSFSSTVAVQSHQRSGTLWLVAYSMLSSRDLCREVPLGHGSELLQVRGPKSGVPAGCALGGYLSTASERGNHWQLLSHSPSFASSSAAPSLPTSFPSASSHILL